MRSWISSALLGTAVLGASAALPAKADASWLSEALNQTIDPYYGAPYGPVYPAYGPDYWAPGYSFYTPGYSYYVPGYVAPYVPYRAWYGHRYYGSPWHGYRNHGHHAGYRGWHGGWHGGHGHHR
jgi:hypothetical protein